MKFVCSACGETHDGLPALVLDPPTPADSSTLVHLTSDTCVHDDEHFFVRCVLLLPIRDAEGTLEFGVWSSLSQANFLRYQERWLRPEGRVDLEPMFGWFSNSLPGYPETFLLKCHVVPRSRGLRPLIELEATDHPLAVQQRDGVSLDEAVRYVHEHLDL